MKKNTIFYIIITILLIIIAVGITYIIMDNKNGEKIPETNNKEENNNEEETVLKDGVTLKDTYQKNDSIIQEYEMILNNQQQSFNINFNILEQTGYFEIEASINNKQVFKIMNDFESTSDNYIEYISNYFNENNFYIVTGKDNKNYLVVLSYFLPPAGGPGLNYLVFNNDWNFIGQLDVIKQGQSLVLENEDIFYENKIVTGLLNNYPEEQIRSKIENNKIYNLYYDGCEEGMMEERIYSINNNKLEYTVINEYKVSLVSGSC